MNIFSVLMTPGILSGAVNGEKDFDANLALFEAENAKPAIDDVICKYLDGDTLKNALSFIDFVRGSKMKIKWTAANVWSVRYKNKRVLDIIVREDTWRVRLVYDHIVSNAVFSQKDKENIKGLIGMLSNSMPETLELAPALS